MLLRMQNKPPDYGKIEPEPDYIRNNEILTDESNKKILDDINENKLENNKILLMILSLFNFT